MIRRRVVLAVGSNLGDRLGTLTECVQALRRLPDTDVLAISPVYQTAPVGGPAQPDYLNAVLIASTGLGPYDLLAAAHAIETASGRVRAERFGPRTLDVDIISYADEVSADPVLTLPHPRAHERAFVLAPWHDIDPEASLPGHGTVRDLLKGLDTGGVRREPDLVLPSPSGGDAGSDAGPDAGGDAGPDAGGDAGPDAGGDAGPDAGPGNGIR